MLPLDSHGGKGVSQKEMAKTALTVHAPERPCRAGLFPPGPDQLPPQTEVSCATTDVRYKQACRARGWSLQPAEGTALLLGLVEPAAVAGCPEI